MASEERDRLIQNLKRLGLAARHIVAVYREMHDALDEYRALLPTEHELAIGTDDIPF